MSKLVFHSRDCKRFILGGALLLLFAIVASHTCTVDDGSSKRINDQSITKTVKALLINVASKKAIMPDIDSLLLKTVD
jgi:hypothetical protein